MRNQKLYDNFSKILLQFLGGKRYEPMGQLTLFKRLKISPAHYPVCKEIITDLIQKGAIEVHKKRLVLKTAQPDTITGVLRLHQRGFGFVVPDDPAKNPQDIFIPKHLTNNAVDGDIVEVWVNPESTSDKGPEGKIVTIIKRSRTHLGGTVNAIDREGTILAYAPLLGVSKPVFVRKDKDTVLKVGDRIIMKVITWGDETEATVGEVSQLIGHISDPGCDVKAAVEEFELRGTFPPAVISEAKEYGEEVTKKDLKGRKNFTKEECFTIDPETARDYDDALTLTVDKKGNFHLGVHIADVAHYVHPDSALDKEAQLRCNSTYFPGAVVPMLPEELSNNLCSLKADVIRLTASVLMDFDKEGNLLKHEIVRSYIKSARRFTYEEAKKVIDGKLKSPHKKTLDNMVNLCHLLKKKRHERGSIDFSLPDMVIVINAKGEPEGVKWVEYDITHQLVEEFMLKANEMVATHLSSEGKAVLYRIHEEPSAENIEDFYTLARSFGFAVPPKPTPQDVQKLFEMAKKTPFGYQLSVSFIRSMKLAYYSPENVGHFGLGLEFYCHFTSPIRRYSDLIIQRQLFEEETELAKMHAIALRCSEQERISFRAEMSVKTLKKLRLLQHYYNENPTKSYAAIITRIKPFGLYFDVSELMLEGFLHISELEDDYFVFDSVRNRLVGRSSGKVHMSGEPIQVQVRTIDMILLETKWDLVSTSSRNKKKSHGSRKNRR